MKREFEQFEHMWRYPVGKYGRIHLYDAKDGRVFVDVVQGTTDGMYADELRAAASFFNKLAAALEENAR